MHEKLHMHLMRSILPTVRPIVHMRVKYCSKCEANCLFVSSGSTHGPPKQCACNRNGNKDMVVKSNHNAWLTEECATVDRLYNQEHSGLNCRAQEQMLQHHQGCAYTPHICRLGPNQCRCCTTEQGKLRPYLAEAHHTPHYCPCPARSCAEHSQKQRESRMQMWFCASWPQAVFAAAAPAGGRLQGLGCRHSPHLSSLGRVWTGTRLCHSAQPLDRFEHLLHLLRDLQPDRQKASSLASCQIEDSDLIGTSLQEAMAFGGHTHQGVCKRHM